MKTVSVVIPVYNAERHLAQTLDSLLSQSYEHIELICVDDGSSDNSLNILRSYESADERVRVIHQENGGVSRARNKGIAHCSGDIIMFVDADDTLVPHACEKIVDTFAAHQPDMVTFGLVCDPPEAAPASLRRELTPRAKTYQPYAPALLFKEHARPYACRTAISREFCQSEAVQFEPDVRIGEDQIFYFATYPFSRKTILLDEQLYIYRMNDSSATHTLESLTAKLDQHFLVIEAILRIWAERGITDFGSCSELLEWILDFLMLDLSKLPLEDQLNYYKRLMNACKPFYGENLANWICHIPTKRCINAITLFLAGNGQTAVKFLDMSMFYLMRRGLIRCIERILIRLRILK